MREPKFLYFDLGKVLVDFTVERMFRQMAEVAGIDAAAVERAVFDGGLQQQYEIGQISGEEFYDGFCRLTGTRADPQALETAGSDIFVLNVRMLPVVAQLRQAGYPMGILSNTCESHWEHCRRRFRILEACFSRHALSYRIKAVKPDAAIFHAAAELAGVAPEEIFFTDDTPGHVDGAKAAGFDAVTYTSTHQCVAELRARGVELNH